IAASEGGQMAASDYVPIFFKNRPQMGSRPNKKYQSPRSNSETGQAQTFLACVSRSASLCQAWAISTRKVFSRGSTVVRASCRHRIAYRWQSFATDIFYPPN